MDVELKLSEKQLHDRVMVNFECDDGTIDEAAYSAKNALCAIDPHNCTRYEARVQSCARR